ncbi:MAG: PGPGW domain-containing protein [archaeon]
MKSSIMFGVEQIKELIIIIVGVMILLIGPALLFLPGLGILIIILGLVVLAIEFIWARGLLKKAKQLTKIKIFRFRWIEC